MVPNVTTPEKKNQGIHVLAYRKSGSPFLKENIMGKCMKTVMFVNLLHGIKKQFAQQILDFLSSTLSPPRSES